MLAIRPSSPITNVVITRRWRREFLKTQAEFLNSKTGLFSMELRAHRAHRELNVVWVVLLPMHCIYNEKRRCSNGTGTTCKIRAHRIKREEAEQALLNDPIPIYEQDVEGELRVVYYGENHRGPSRRRPKTRLSPEANARRVT